MTHLEIMVLLTAYFLGAFPSGVLLSRAFGMSDPRTVGSKNPGATNMLRQGRKDIAALTLLLDAGKGSVAVALAYVIAPYLAPLCALICVLGHVFPVWLKFKGGKGIATSFGAMLVLYWPLAICLIAAWGAVFAATRVSSLAALSAIATGAAAAFVVEDRAFSWVLGILALLLVWTHRANIARLRHGREGAL